jgi:hypothetical protein
MFTLRKSMVLGAAFFAGAAIAARADRLCRIPIGPRRRPGRQIVARSSASVALAPDSDTPPEVNVFGPQPAGAAYKVVHVDTRDRWRS